jgi:hypothetical protein
MSRRFALTIVQQLKYVFMLAAAVGFGCSAAVHVLSWLGVTLPQSLMFLHVGIFVVWIPTVFVTNRLTRNYKQKDVWRGSLRGAPPWASKALTVLFVYAFVHFFASLFLLKGRLGVPEVETFRLFSGHWMIFYGFAWGVLYSAIHADDEDRMCPQGHALSPGARFCEVCGAPVAAGRDNGTQDRWGRPKR